MQFIVRHQNGLKSFELLKHKSELAGASPPNKSWILVDYDSSLETLLRCHKMLDFTKAELLAAQMLTNKNTLWRKSQSSRDYCQEQASLISVYADDAIERVASQIIPPHEFENTEYGVPTWIRRLTLAFVQELGVKL
jgi:hypothetical protein